MMYTSTNSDKLYIFFWYRKTSSESVIYLLLRTQRDLLSAPIGMKVCKEMRVYCLLVITTTDLSPMVCLDNRLTCTTTKVRPLSYKRHPPMPRALVFLSPLPLPPPVDCALWRTQQQTTPETRQTRTGL